jgi:hypothetical protein
MASASILAGAITCGNARSKPIRASSAGTQTQGVVDELHARALLARGHPLREEGPCAIRQQAPQGALTVWRPLDALDGQTLADEGVPGIVDDDGTLKRRSM